MKIQLTIKTSYLPKWGAYEGIRELIQNARDAQVEHDASLKVDWYNDTLRIENEGVTLPTKALLLGHTTKLGRSDMIGKFGEGLKLGVLALVRAGHPVRIRNGSEVWTPSIERSTVFDEDVLAFNIEKGRKESARVRIEIGGVTKEDWRKFRECFLFLRPAKDAVETSFGSLLRGETYRGKVFVKGIFVQRDPELRFGYDLKDAELDRDRKMVESYNLQYRTREILLEALNNEDMGMFPVFQEMLEESSPEVRNLSTYTTIPDAAAKFIADRFTAKYGSDAVPVESLAISKDMEHLGAKGVVVNGALGIVLSKTLDNAMTVQDRLKKEVVETFGWHELNATEKASLESAIALVDDVTLDDISVVSFRSPALHGQYKNGQSFLARGILSDPEETLATLIHEVAHGEGGDGDHAHIAQIELLWKAAVRKLRGR